MSYVSHFYESARHPSSLLPFTSHNPALLFLIESGINEWLISEVASRFARAIQVVEEEVISFRVHYLPTPPYSPKQLEIIPEIPSGFVIAPAFDISKTISLEEFISHVTYAARANVAMLLTTIIYLERLCQVPDSTMTKGKPDLPYKVFLTAFMVAAKYLNDYPPGNPYFVACAQDMFSLKEVNSLERELLKDLQYNVGVSESDVQRVWKPFIAPLEKLLGSRTAPVRHPPTPPLDEVHCDNAFHAKQPRSKRQPASVVKSRTSERSRIHKQKLQLNKKLNITKRSTTAH